MMETTTAPAGRILLSGTPQCWVKSLDTGTGGNMAQISLLGGDDSQPVNITASILMAVVSPELQLLLHQSGCFCQAPVIISIPSTTRSTLQLVSQVLCHGQAELLGEQDVRRSYNEVKDVLELMAPGVIIENMIMNFKEEEDDDSCLRSSRWVRRGIKVDLSETMESDSGMEMDVSGAEGMLSDVLEEEAGSCMVDEAVRNLVNDHDYDYTLVKVVEAKLGKKINGTKKVKACLNKDVWKGMMKNHLTKKVQKLNLSVLDCGLIRSKYSLREVRELVPRKIKKESDDPEDKIECGICSKIFTTAPSIASHMVTHSASRDDVFSAEFSKLVNHVRSRHLKEKVYNCTICQAEFSTHSAKSSHMLKHSRSDINGHCKNCNKFYNKALGKGCTSCSKK